MPEQIKQFREALDLSQEEFARALGVKRLAVSTWESRSSRPSKEALVSLAKLAQKHDLFPQAIQFWEQAGVTEAVLRMLVPEAERSFRSFEKRLKELLDAHPSEFVPLPLVENLAHGDHESVISQIRARIREGAEVYVPFPKSIISVPQSTVCVRAPDDYMRPIFHEGDFLAVDISCSGKPSPEGAHELARMMAERVLIPLGDRSIFAAYYQKPKNPPRWHGREGLHARAALFMLDAEGKPTGNIHLTTEMGLNLAAAARALGGRPRSDLKEVEEASDAIIPIDPGLSIVGQVIAWVGSAWEPRQQGRSEHLADNFGIIGGHLNKFQDQPAFEPHPAFEGQSASGKRKRK